MHKISEYETSEKLHEGEYTQVFRARSVRDSKPVIIKTIISNYPEPGIVSRIKREYDIISRFQSDGVVQTLNYVDSGNRPAIVFEDFGASSLLAHLEPGPLALGDFLSLGIRLANILGEIHGQNIIHKDINPANIVWNQEEDRVKIIDFGISLELSREVTGIKNPNVLEGTLAYISPEQTGRMNRFLDYRTDFYSLGVTFYRILSGRLPFEYSDPMEMVYGHIARQAPTLHELNSEIPRVVSDIVEKLMAKNVEERYQSAFGLACDLSRCLSEWRDTGRIAVFTPGQEDVSNRFHIPQTLYGRENEIAELLAAFERTAQGEKEMMLVSGSPGIGKSALVNEIQKPIVKLRGNFIAGKFDLFKKDVPYSALIEAYSGLIRNLLAENEERLANWKSKILAVLGPNGKVITDVIPELEFLIGKQADIPDLGPDESRNRFNLYFRFFTGVFCKAEHPLVFFLDDLQWADHASLEMLNSFLSDPDIKHLFVIGSYRHTEVEQGHMLNLILDDMKKKQIRINSIAIMPLGLKAVVDLLNESLNQDTEQTKPLAELLLRKTSGNPFFLSEFLKTLYKEEQLQFVPGQGWTWDIHEITALPVTDNVVKLMADKIEYLPPECGAILKLGACFGNRFELDVMSEISGTAVSELQTSLNILMEEGLLIKLERFYKFSHDRIQEAAYSLLTQERRSQEHHRIGQFELKQCTGEELTRKIFYIVNQLNAGREMIHTETDRMGLARLNLAAGTRARSSAAYQQALKYLELALGLLDGNAWKNHYELTLTIHQEAANAAFLRGDYEQMDRLAETVIKSAHDVLDTTSVYEAQIFAAMARNRPLRAVRIGQIILKELGLNLPQNPGKVHIVKGLMALKLTLWGKSMDELEKIPEMQDPRKLAMVRILSGVGSSAYFALPDLMPLIVFQVIQLSVKYGNTEFTPYAYAALGMIHCGILGDIDKGHEFGQLALRILDNLNVQEGRARTLFVVTYAIQSWKEHLRKTLPPLKTSLRLAMETGDPEYICHSANSMINHGLLCGVTLDELEPEMLKIKGMVANLKHSIAVHSSQVYHQFFLNLKGEVKDPARLQGESYDIESYLEVHKSAGDQNNIFVSNIYACILSLLFGKPEKALEHIEQAQLYLDSMMSSPWVPVWCFYKSLSQLALYPEVSKSRRKKFIRNVNGFQKKMKTWAGNSPMNYEHKYQLVEAEKARILGFELKARRHYRLAIDGARKNQYKNEEAMALELYAIFLLEFDAEESAALYMNKARQGFRAWGALAKVIDLEDCYPRLFEGFQGDRPGSSEEVETRTTSIHESTGRTTGGQLDIATVMKGSQAIAGEILLGNLLRKVMGIVMQNAGARSGYLIVESGNGFCIEAAGDMGSNEVTVLQSMPLEKCTEISAAVVQYAARTEENVVLKDASTEGQFVSDPGIIANKAQSILCSPIFNQGKLSAILYLENNLSVGAFTPDRLEVLGMLSSQIAVSIDNARLYANLEDKVKERTTELSATLKQIQDLKTRQDGDYFLTSRLIGPLARNEVQSERVTVDFLVEQKKQFKFRKWEDELGGDLCIAHSLQLDNSPHTVFLNADAMGKSMQGAGGALVLGAVFQSIMERTKLPAYDPAQSSSEWLKDVFAELQKVFESFDGSMLISLVMGTVNDQTGDLLFFNAEHPWTTLYRDGKARFLEQEISLHKLGTPGQGALDKIYKFKLQKGDVFIAGSDGRDDILLSVSEEAEGAIRDINSDENLFLKRVEEGDGELSEIKKALLKQGELTDDLSLLRLEYK